MKLVNGIVFLWHSFRRLKPHCPWHHMRHLPIQTRNLTFIAYAAMQGVQEVKEVLKVLHNISMHRYTPTQMEKSSRPSWSSVSHSRILQHAAKAYTVCHCIGQRNKFSFCVCLSFHSESKEPKRDHKNWSKKTQKTNKEPQCTVLSVVLRK